MKVNMMAHRYFLEIRTHWLLLREQFSASIDDLAELRLGFSSTQATNRDSRRVSRDHGLAALFPHIQIQATLDDAEEILRRGILVGCNATI